MLEIGTRDNILSLTNGQPVLQNSSDDLTNNKGLCLLLSILKMHLIVANYTMDDIFVPLDLMMKLISSMEKLSTEIVTLMVTVMEKPTVRSESPRFGLIRKLSYEELTTILSNIERELSTTISSVKQQASLSLCAKSLILLQSKERNTEELPRLGGSSRCCLPGGESGTEESEEESTSGGIKRRRIAEIKEEEAISDACFSSAGTQDHTSTSHTTAHGTRKRADVIKNLMGAKDFVASTKTKRRKTIHHIPATLCEDFPNIGLYQVRPYGEVQEKFPECDDGSHPKRPNLPLIPRIREISLKHLEVQRSSREAVPGKIVIFAMLYPTFPVNAIYQTKHWQNSDFKFLMPSDNVFERAMLNIRQWNFFDFCKLYSESSPIFGSVNTFFEDY